MSASIALGEDSVCEAHTFINLAVTVVVKGVAFFGTSGTDCCVPVITVITSKVSGEVPVSVCIVVIITSAVAVDTVVPGIWGAWVDSVVAVISVVATVCVGLVAIGIGVKVIVSSAVAVYPVVPRIISPSVDGGVGVVTVVPTDDN